MNKIAIITPFNDIEKIDGGSRSGVKQKISYFDQFLILYSSIIDNWKDVNFSFYFVVIHSIPFNNKRRKILDKLQNLEIRLVNYNFHKFKIRPIAYQLELDCDYRLILDVDMYALKPPVFNFDVDAQAMYGGNKYNDSQWEEICNFIGATKPQYKNNRTKQGNSTNWGIKDHVDYHLEGHKELMFPYFNNGAVLVKNKFSKQLGQVWQSYKMKYIEYIRSKELKANEISAGQNVIGVAIDNCVDKWKPFEPGFNFILQDSFELGKKLMDEFNIKDVQLFHYINVPRGSLYENLILDKYKEVRKKYYLIWKRFL